MRTRVRSDWNPALMFLGYLTISLLKFKAELLIPPQSCCCVMRQRGEVSRMLFRTLTDKNNIFKPSVALGQGSGWMEAALGYGDHTESMSNLISFYQ